MYPALNVIERCSLDGSSAVSLPVLKSTGFLNMLLGLVHDNILKGLKYTRYLHASAGRPLGRLVVSLCWKTTEKCVRKMLGSDIF